MKYRNAILASEIVERVMTEGEETHPGQPYQEVGLEENLRHASDHLYEAIEGESATGHKTDRIEELEHALCRISMALECIEREAQSRASQ